MLLDEFAPYNVDVNATDHVFEHRITLLTRLSNMVLLQARIKRSMEQLMGRQMRHPCEVTSRSLKENHRLANLHLPVYPPKSNGTKP